MMKSKIRNVLTSSISRVKATISKVAGLPGRFKSFLVIGWKLSRTGRTVEKVTNFLSKNWAAGRSLTTLEHGFTTVDSKYTIFLSDLEGSDMKTEFKAFVDLAIGAKKVDGKLTYDKKYWNCPIKIFCNSGVLGMYARCEYSILFVLDGVPFILSSRVRLEGTDEYDPAFKTADHTTLSGLLSENSNKVVSLGFVDPNTAPAKLT